MSTTIIAIRHAKPLSVGYADETLRPLHTEGIAAQIKMSHLLVKKGYSIDKVLSSPIIRAMQTAEIIAETFSIEVEKTDALGYAFNSSFLLKKILTSYFGKTIALIGHAPSLGEFVNELAGKKVLPNGLSKSGTAILTFKREIKRGQATFIEYIKP